jgi:hypothetical protein
MERRILLPFLFAPGDQPRFQLPILPPSRDATPRPRPFAK